MHFIPYSLVFFLPVDYLLQVGSQHDDQLLEGAPLLHIERHLLLIFLVLVLLGQRNEDERTFLDDGLAKSVEMFSILRGNILQKHNTYQSFIKIYIKKT